MAARGESAAGVDASRRIHQQRFARSVCAKLGRISARPRPNWLQRGRETWFSILQGQSLTVASFTSVEQLQEHIDAFIAAYNETATPFAWTKKKVHQRRFKNRRVTQL